VPEIAPFLILGLAVGLVGFLAWRATIVFEVRASNGKVVSARGRMPPEMLHDVTDVLARAKATGTVRGRLEQGKVAVRASGLDEGVVQRLRNVVGRFPAARIKTAKRLR
jgi:hypothetical protein